MLEYKFQIYLQVSRMSNLEIAIRKFDINLMDLLKNF